METTQMPIQRGVVKEIMVGIRPDGRRGQLGGREIRGIVAGGRPSAAVEADCSSWTFGELGVDVAASTFLAPC